MKDTRNIYWSRTTKDLRELRSKKIVVLNKLGKVGGYFTRMEVAKLKHQVEMIDAILAAREAQERLF